MGIEKFKLKRSSDGALEAVECQSFTLGLHIKVLPLTYGQSRRMESFGMPLGKWSDTDIAMILDECLVAVKDHDETEWSEVGNVTVADLQELDAFIVQDWVESILQYSAFNRLYQKEQGNGESLPQNQEGK